MITRNQLDQADDYALPTFRAEHEVGFCGCDSCMAESRRRLQAEPPHTLCLHSFRLAWGTVYGEWADSVYDRMCAAARAAAL